MATGTEDGSTLPPPKSNADIPVAPEPVTPAVPAIKRPPPERPESIRARSIVVLSFWAVVVFLGLPVWLWTTSIHRAHLPMQEMLEWADGKVSSIADSAVQ